MIFSYNFQQYDATTAVISPFDHGFLYGMGLFETWRTYGGASFLLDRHLARLSEGLAQLHIRWTPDASQIDAEVRALLAANNLTDGYVRLSVSAGIEPLGLPTGDYTTPNVVIMVKSVGEAAFASNAPRDLQLLTTTRLTPETDVRMKSFHYMNSILGKQEMAAYPWAAQAEGLMLTAGGDIAEGITSNVFFVKDGVLHTPAVATGILPGVTRAFVIELAEQAGVPVEQGFYTWDDLCGADEIFITNSVQAIVPVRQLFEQDGKAVSIANARLLTTSLQQSYERAVQKVGDQDQ
jgi:4-amino-4-deoxychorismate lyase